MGRTLNLLNHCIARARHLVSMEQFRDAVQELRRVGKLPSLPAGPAAEIQHLLGEALLKLGQFRLARRHLRHSVRLAPANALAYRLLARAIESDPQANAVRAANAYRRALSITPRDPRLLADAGAYYAQMGRERKGLTLLTQAMEIAPDDLTIFRAYIDTLCELERYDDALAAIDIAGFRFRREPRLAHLREQTEFRQVRMAQRRSRREQTASSEESPVVLPFLRVVGDQAVSGGTRYRCDTIIKIRPHLPRVPRQMDSGRSG